MFVHFFGIAIDSHPLVWVLKDMLRPSALSIALIRDHLLDLTDLL